MSDSHKADAANRLGVEPVGRLLLKFSIPAVTGMLLNALYNVVDRAFVGHGVDELALGGLSLVMPLQTITMAFSMLFGLGAANMISLRLGEQRKLDAEKALNHALCLLVGAAIVLMVLQFIFLDGLISMLGAREGSASIEYARNYYRIIIAGQIFNMVGFGMSHCTRAQGFPAISMIGMILGAGINTILDPIFIFGLKWGVEGAALATVISQCCATIWFIYFNTGKRGVIKFRLSLLKLPSLTITRSILSLGSAQFLLQFAMSAVQLVINKSMGWYGEESLGIKGGGDIALSGMNSVVTIAFLILMPVFGLNQGSQPVLGYNYGAKKFKRVKRAYTLTMLVATCFCTAGFLFVEIFPNFVARLFISDGSAELMQWTRWALRVSLALLPLNGFQIISVNMFVVTGRPKVSILLSMLRQAILLIPAILILGRYGIGKYVGVYGVVIAQPLVDFCTFIITGILVSFEIKKLNRQIRNIEA
jgi:putative MATE family efflux protein